MDNILIPIALLLLGIGFAGIGSYLRGPDKTFLDELNEVLEDRKKKRGKKG